MTEIFSPAVRLQNELALLMLEFAIDDQDYLTAKDPDTTPRFQEIVVTRHTLALSSFHYADEPTVEFRIQHPELLNHCGGDCLDRDGKYWRYRLKSATIDALVFDDAYYQLMAKTINPLRVQDFHRHISNKEHDGNLSFEREGLRYVA